MHPVRRLALLAFLASTFCTALMLAGYSQYVPSALAAPEDGVASFSLRPIKSQASAATKQSYFIFDAAPDAMVQGAIRVTNSGTATGTVQLYSVDATTGQSGGIVYRTSQEPRQDVGAWLVLNTDSLTLAPGGSQIVTFTSAIPADASAGTHLGGIVAANLSPQTASDQGNIHIKIQHISVVAVQIEVAGPTVEHVEVTSITQQATDYRSVQLGVKNTGSVLVKPTGQLQILDSTNQVVRDISFKLGQMLPQANIDVPVALGGEQLDAGVYQAVVTLTYGQDSQQSVSRLKLNIGQALTTLPLSQIKLPSGDLQPLSLALIGVLALAATLAIILIVRRARRRLPRQPKRSSLSQTHSHYAPYR